jgi:hypothetical protein
MSRFKLLFGRRRVFGAGLVEAAASVALLLPLFLVLLNVTAVVVHVYMIKGALTQASSRAAREMTIHYWKNNQIAKDRALQDSLVYDKLRIANVINDSAQFSNAQFDLAANPPVVSVTVTFAAGKYGLPSFPQPHLLNLNANFAITSTHTHALE